MSRILYGNHRILCFGMFTKKIIQRPLSEHIVRSPYPYNPNLISNQPLAKFLLNRLEKSPELRDEICLIDGSTHESLTFGQQYELTYRVAASLHKLGIQHGMGVAVISPNHINYFSLMNGTNLTGGYSIPVNPLCSEQELLYQLELAEAKLVFVHPSMLQKALSVTCKLNIQCISIDNNISGVPGVSSYSEFLANQKFPDIDIHSFPSKTNSFDISNIAVVPFSSGTTGKMKGVMLSHHNIMANIIQLMHIEGKNMEKSRTGERGILLTPLPFFHIYAMTAQLFMGYYAGCKTIFLPQFDLLQFLELIQNYKVTRLHFVPPIALTMAKHPVIDKYDLSSLECAMSGAAPLGSDVQRECATRLKCLVKQAWGMTELSPAGSGYRDEDAVLVENIVGKAGILVGGTEGKIVDPLTGVDLPSNQEGEVLVRGPQVMKGYLKNPEATKVTIRLDGWLHTGDIGYFDQDGVLTITDRAKELIKYKGCQVPPAELEAIILSMPQVKDAIVIPVLDDEAGEIPRAYVIKQENCPESFKEENIVEYVNARVSPQKKLRGGVRFTNTIPKSASGKLLRRVQIQIDRGEISI